MARGNLLERDAELRTLEATVAEARAGTGSVVTISASAGLGKTRLLAVASELAGQAGLEVLQARGSELQHAVPYALAREALEGALRHRAPSDRERALSGGAAPAAGVLHGGAGPAPDAGDALLGLYWLIANLADTGPVALVVDDVQWADPRSLDLLEFLAPRLRDLPVALVVASRPPAGSAVDPLARLDAGAPERLDLQPMSVRATRRLLRARLGKPVAPEFATACHTVTGGNPFYLGELARELGVHAIAPTAAAAGEVDGLGPNAIARATLVRLLRVSPDAVIVARTLAVLGDGVPVDVVAAHAGRDEQQVIDALAGLVREAVLADERPVRFAHPIVRAAIASDMTAVERGGLHSRAAGVLHDRGAPAEQVAAHLLESEPGGAGPWAAGELRAAATAATDRGVPASAAKLLRRMLAEPATGATWEPLLELGTAAFHAGDPDALDHLRAAYAAAPDAESRARAALALALPRVSAGAIPEAVAGLRDALAELGEGGELAEELRAQLSALAPLDPALTAEVMRELELRADTEPATPAARRTLANLAQWTAMQGAPAERVADLAQRALAAGRLLEEAGPNSPSFLYATFLLIAADRFDAARTELEAAVELATRRGSVSGFTWASMMRSLLAYREGALDRAVADAQIATDVAAQHGWGTGLPATVGFLVDALIEQGRLDEAQTALARAGVGDDVPDTLLVQAYLVARGRLAAARGELEPAVETLEELARQTTGEGWSGIVGTPTYRTYLAPALAALGQGERSAQLAAEEVELAMAWGAPRAMGTALRVQGVVAGRDGGAELLAEAVRVLEATPARLEHARALADLGAALRRDGKASAAREPLREAIDLADRCGAAPLVAYAQDELAATGARRTSRRHLTGVESLTPSEQRIAGMAADGLSNGEIARALFLTRKTIEMHLGNAYKKLGIHSRAELGDAMRSQGGTP